MDKVSDLDWSWQLVAFIYIYSRSRSLPSMCCCCNLRCRSLHPIRRNEDERLFHKTTRDPATYIGGKKAKITCANQWTDINCVNHPNVSLISEMCIKVHTPQWNDYNKMQNSFFAFVLCINHDDVHGILLIR